MEKSTKKRLTLLIDMYGVIIKESKGYFIPYTFEHFEQTEYDRLKKAFREENLFTRAGNGEMSSNAFLSRLGYVEPAKTMRDYLENYLTLDDGFIRFAEKNYKHCDFILLSNDVSEWSQYLFELHGLRKYFKDSIVSGDVHMRKPEPGIFSYTLERLRRSPGECTFIDNSVRNLDAAQGLGINTVLFNRDNESYSGNTVNSFEELEQIFE